jgi:hypothetical protein
MRILWAVFGLFLLRSGQALGQDQPSIDAMKQILDVSQRRGQLEMEGGMPFHLVASFEEFDENGKPAGKGLIDEIWESPIRYQMVLTLPELKETKSNDGTAIFSQDFALPPRKLIHIDNGKQEWRTGRWVLFGETVRGIDAVLRPLYLRPTISNRITYEPEPKDKGPLDCLGTEPDLPGVADNTQLALTTYCFSKGSHLIRLIYLPNGQEIAFNEVMPFGKKYVARSIDIAANGKMLLRLHVDFLEAAENFDSLETPPPATAQLLWKHQVDIPDANASAPRLSGEVMMGQPLKKVMVGGAHGKITVRVHIDTTGAVESVQVVDASNQVIKAPYLTAMKNWKFRVSYQGYKIVAVDRSFSFDGGPD